MFKGDICIIACMESLLQEVGISFKKIFKIETLLILYPHSYNVSSLPFREKHILESYEQMPS